MRVGPVRHFIGNEFVESQSGRTFSTLNPTTNEVITEVAEGNEVDVDRAVQAAWKAFHEGPWPRMRAEERAGYLRRVGELILKHAEEIGVLEVLDTGTPISQAGGTQIPRAAENFFFAEMASRILGITYMKLAEIIQEADLPPGVSNVVQGYGETAGAALVAHPQASLISFTGESRTGVEILRNAAPTLKRCSMELGGKNPTIVFADADLDRALDAAVFMGYSLNGERCTSGSRLLVERQVYDTFLERFAARVQALRVGDPFDPATEVGPLIHPEHWQRVRGYVELARAEGATVLVGGDRPENLSHGNYLQPTLIVDVRPEMRVAREEIFGPVVVIPFEEEEALRIANGVRYGLAAYLWTREVHRAHRIAQALEAGMVWVNSHNVRDLRTPFGGMKHSGIGREGGEFSFEFYCEYQTIHVALGGHAIPRMGMRA
ncbi:MAG: aldehyde dehydrogenase [Armatimonadota bacterium]|nr:aldehyde dehydrogenase [Armatimonadota bacterium]MDR7440266.1 aldehyde dehydrogenase [Armatimonadota bacterium]MDR7443837.1 aldehyde dehydrogenase [Armatimonadota bacterium]MDR7568994.1 aldehyde dehydrogenase [Armatimonadota bacterium]MDR7613883.1 aldehyde dehydrogenase [Armatimonadota bacterium]